jgi:hypothetical protein
MHRVPLDEELKFLEHFVCALVKHGTIPQADRKKF